MESANGEKFITLFIAKYHYLRKKLEYINAGHNPALLFQMTENKLSLLSSGCVGMGMLDELPFINSSVIHIDSPSKLLCYTDGLVELIEGDNVDYGYKYIEEEISNQHTIDVNIKEMIVHNKIIEGSTAIFDDISILGVQFSGN